MEAHHLGWNAVERDVGSLDIDLGAPLLLRVVEAGLEENVGQEGIVDLHQNAGRHDCLVFLVQLACERVEIFFLRLVVLVDADPEARCRRHEHVMIGDARGLGRRFQIVDVDSDTFSPRYFTGAMQTTGDSGTMAPPIIASLKYCA